jgi:hypothetical protein
MIGQIRSEAQRAFGVYGATMAEISNLDSLEDMYKTAQAALDSAQKYVSNQYFEPNELVNKIDKIVKLTSPDETPTLEIMNQVIFSCNEVKIEIEKIMREILKNDKFIKGF